MYANSPLQLPVAVSKVSAGASASTAAQAASGDLTNAAFSPASSALRNPGNPLGAGTSAAAQTNTVSTSPAGAAPAGSSPVTSPGSPAAPAGAPGSTPSPAPAPTNAVQVQPEPNGPSAWSGIKSLIKTCWIPIQGFWDGFAGRMVGRDYDTFLPQLSDVDEKAVVERMRSLLNWDPHGAMIGRPASFNQRIQNKGDPEIRKMQVAAKKGDQVLLETLYNAWAATHPA